MYNAVLQKYILEGRLGNQVRRKKLKLIFLIYESTKLAQQMFIFHETLEFLMARDNFPLKKGIF